MSFKEEVNRSLGAITRILENLRLRIEDLEQDRVRVKVDPDSILKPPWDVTASDGNAAVEGEEIG